MCVTNFVVKGQMPKNIVVFCFKQIGCAFFGVNIKGVFGDDVCAFRFKNKYPIDTRTFVLARFLVCKIKTRHSSMANPPNAA